MKSNSNVALPRRVETRPTPREIPLEGNAAGPEVAPIDRALCELDRIVDEIEKRAACLAQKIGPVLCPKDGYPAPPKEEFGGSEVLRRVMQSAEQLSQVSQTLLALDQACEL
jgi:hypothetical protein